MADMIAISVAILRARAERAWAVVEADPFRGDGDALLDIDVDKLLKSAPNDAAAQALWRDVRIYGAALTARHAPNLAEHAASRLLPALKQLGYGEHQLAAALGALARWDGSGTPTEVVEKACRPAPKPPHSFSNAVKKILEGKLGNATTKRRVRDVIEGLAGDAKLYAMQIYLKGDKAGLTGDGYQKAKRDAEQALRVVPELKDI